MRFRVLGALALVVLTAGCGAFVGGGSSASTVTPAPVPTLETTPEDPRVGVAPGVSTRGITDPDYLAQRHAAIARETSYVLNVSYHQDRRLGDVASTVERRQRIVVENATVYRRDASSMQRRIGDSYQYLYGYAEYADGRTKYVSWLGDTATDRVFRRYADPTTRPRYASITTSAIREYLALDSATVTRFDVDGSDRQHYLVVGNRSSYPGALAVENYTARAVIRADGFVRQLNVTYDAVDRGSNVTTHYAFRYHEVGTATVTPPAWADEARERFAGDRDPATDTTTDAVDDGRGRES